MSNYFFQTPNTAINEVIDTRSKFLDTSTFKIGRKSLWGPHIADTSEDSTDAPKPMMTLPSNRGDYDLRDFLDLIPKLNDVDPSADKFTCIYPVMKEGRRCKFNINQNDLREATSLNIEILKQTVTSIKLITDLSKFAKLCCCSSGKHRQRAMELGDLEHIALLWLQQLDTRQSEDFSYKVNILERFIPYRPLSNEGDFRALLTSPLSKIEHPHGSLYLVEREADPGFYKIGYTTMLLEQRLDYFESKCGFKAKLLRQLSNIPHARRVEKLIHADLIDYRRKDTTCAKRTGCGDLHSEWFQCGPDHIQQAMDQWTRWIIWAQPYSLRSSLLSWSLAIPDCVWKSQRVEVSQLLGVLQEEEAYTLFETFLWQSFD